MYSSQNENTPILGCVYVLYAPLTCYSAADFLAAVVCVCVDENPESAL